MTKLKIAEEVKLGDDIWVYSKYCKEVKKQKVQSISLSGKKDCIRINNYHINLKNSSAEDNYDAIYLNEFSIVKIQLDIEKSQLAKEHKALTNLNKKINALNKKIAEIEKQISSNPTLYGGI